MLEISTGSPGVVTVLTSRKTTTLLAWLMLMDILPWYSFTDTPSSLTTAPGARFGLLPQSLYSHLVFPPSDHGWSSIKPYGTIFFSSYHCCTEVMGYHFHSISTFLSSPERSDNFSTFLIGKLSLATVADWFA